MGGKGGRDGGGAKKESVYQDWPIQPLSPAQSSNLPFPNHPSRVKRRLREIISSPSSTSIHNYAEFIPIGGNLLVKMMINKKLTSLCDHCDIQYLSRSPTGDVNMTCSQSTR